MPFKRLCEGVRCRSRDGGDSKKSNTDNAGIVINFDHLSKYLNFDTELEGARSTCHQRP
jgi:hypothetical protein